MKIILLVAVIAILSISVISIVLSQPSTRFCGDGICYSDEDCAIDCYGQCGDNVCTGYEPVTCVSDCIEQPYCGDGNCDYDENHNNCIEDCNLPYWCGDGYCASDENRYTCPQDCGQPDYCGDSSCDFDENSYNCPQDCGISHWCGDDYCNNDENINNCYDDCKSETYCGDGLCTGAETQLNCKVDCGSPSVCGDGVCQSTETRETCSVDCGSPCGNQCQLGYSFCSGDTVFVCVNSGNCRVWEAQEVCGTNQVCSGGECITADEKDWLTIYNQLRENDVSDYYTQERGEFDFNSPVPQIASSLYQQSNSVQEYVKNVAQYVYDNVDYDWDSIEEGYISSYCLENTASDVLNNGLGVCATQSKAVIALLRFKGIAARFVAGCACENYGNDYCGALFSIGERPPITPEPIYEDGKLVIAGTGHGWVEAWLPEYGWTIVESTNGYAYNILCYRYMRRGVILDDNVDDMCFLDGEDYINECLAC